MTDSQPAPPDSKLNYLSPVAQPHRFGTPAWISLLVTGILELLGVFCATSGLVVVMVKPGFVRTLPRSPTALHRVMIVWAVLYVILPLAASITKITCAVKVRRGSVSGLITAVIVVGVETMGLLVLTAIVIRNAVVRKTAVTAELIDGFVVVAVVGAVLAVQLSILVRAWMRSRRKEYVE